MPAQTKGKKNIREEFLAQFVRHLIVNSYKPEQKTSLDETAEISHKKIPIVNIARPLEPEKQKTIMQPIKRFIAPFKPIKSKPISQMFSLSPVSPSPTEGGRIVLGSSINLGKITQILADPSVFSVECPGPAKNLLVNRAGSIQTSSLTLTKEEIEKTMEEVSEKTRIPLAPGLFKAAFQNFIITAVLSEFVGTRFIVQKKNPLARY